MMLRAVALLVVAGLSGASCHVHQSGWPPPAFPPASGPTVLAIRDPLEGRELSVPAQVTGKDARQAPLWMLVDSGASEVFLPAELARLVGLHEVEHGRSIGFGRAASAAMTVALLPELTLGDLRIRQLMVGTNPHDATTIRGAVGQSVLRHAPWEISWDRGTVTLDARPWPSEPGVSAMPLERSERFPTDEILVRINGQPVKMLLDTGASTSTLPEDVATSLGLPAESFPPLPAIVGVGGAVRVEHLYTGSLAIGGTEIADQTFFGVPAHQPAVIGLDVLSRFNLLIIPGQRLLLTARGDLRTTAAARVGRWAWIPKSCASPGCLQARIDREGLQLVAEAQLPFTVEVLLGCAAPEAASPFPAPDSGQVIRRLRKALDRKAGLLPRPAAPAPLPAPSPALAARPPHHHLAVRMFGVGPGPRTVVAPRVAERWFSGEGLGCGDLEVLDVVPLVSAKDVDATVLVWLVP
jgi:predicted aspartyl protease